MLRRKRTMDDFSAEVAAHIALETERLRGEGMSERAARTAARRAFGNEGRARERFYERTHWMAGEECARDVRLAWRGLRGAPGFALAAVVTLAVAIGANAVAFSALDAAKLRPLAVPQTRSLYELQPRKGDTDLHESYPDYLAFNRRNRSFNGLAAYSLAQAGLNSGRRPEEVWLEEVSGNYFDVLGLRPYRGRFFHAADERGANSAPFAVLSYAYWLRHFGGDRGVVGRTIELNRHPFTVTGIAPRGFQGTLLFFTPQFFVPLVDEPMFEGTNYLHHRAWKDLFVGAFGHLKPGVTPAAAAADLNAIGADLNRTYPQAEQPYRFTLKRPGLYGDFIGRPMRAFTTALMVLAGLILLAACANLASLFAARGRERGREVAMRLALGAGRGRILRQLFTESALVALAGGGLGLWGSANLLRWLSAWQPFPQFPIHIPVSPDARMIGLALGLALVSAVLLGAAPAWQALHTDPYPVIKSGAADGGRRRVGLRQALLGVQVALCALLLTASLVAVRGLQRSMHADVGFRPEHTLLVQTDMRMAGYGKAAAPAMQKRMLQAVEGMPGVTAAGLTDWAPLGMEGWKTDLVFRDAQTDLRPAAAAAEPSLLRISPGYFRAAGTALLAGRSLRWSDDRHAPRVAVVNRAFARKMYGTEPGAVGRYFKLPSGQRVEVVGLVQNGKFNSLTEPQEPAMFVPLLQVPAGATVMVVRSRRGVSGLAAAIRGKLAGLDRGLPTFIEPWTQAMDGALFPARVAAVALGILGLMGGLLSLTGIFGMAAYAVSRRKRELGIRMALGAQRREVLGAALGPALRLLGWGSAAGLALGLLASRLLAAVVFEASPRDPVVMAGVALAMAAIGLAATWVPAQRALGVSPVELLREE
jgi:predicted permease